MHQADAQEAAFVLDAEPFRQIQRVVVAVPGEDAALAEKCGDIGGDGDRRCRTETVEQRSLETLWIGNSIETQPGNGQQAGDQLCEQSTFRDRVVTR